ncbi:hypothetical protein [Agrobacterium tumefaciens]|uniref:hypothetical protein n=1 Tax=Agrobacterium tumefaciens TaxID=358 RepID=UPI0015748119|nr:hypothetical protein [Agrobacterium tumefaciens]NTD85458.1 hypothetical protein [Agrobacterium tumefaciens]NTD90807.1 hypothetical protein [Agrobacterium tumefaciens]NTD96396.1 hypothetical protein [Agrobacterium tumefaciens]NTE15881.1 hypothetical protein [Agrobacterium tumefaciens]NTE23130.1 hypothetical protein [Agrobacterium tumefaciens]
MATGQSILDRLKKAQLEKEQLSAAPLPPAGVLPLIAFYGRDPEAEDLRNRMYAMIDRAMRHVDEELPSNMGGGQKANWTFIDFKDAIAVVNANSSPVEYLISRGEMETEMDEDGMAGARYHTALRIRDLLDGAQVKQLRSPSLEGGGGGGGSSAGDIRGYQLDCMKLVQMLRTTMEAGWAFPLIEAVVWKDDWLDLVPEKKKASLRGTKAKERRKTVIALHYALDRAGLALGYIPEGDVTGRWPEPPRMPPVIRRRILASMASSPLALQT